jgi:hypothetical protein
VRPEALAALFQSQDDGSLTKGTVFVIWGQGVLSKARNARTVPGRFTPPLNGFL